MYVWMKECTCIWMHGCMYLWMYAYPHARVLTNNSIHANQRTGTQVSLCIRHTFTHTHAHARAHTRTHSHTHTQTHFLSLSHTHTHIHTRTHTRTHEHTNTHTHTQHKWTHIHTHTHSNTYVHLHTHIHVCITHIHRTKTVEPCKLYARLKHLGTVVTFLSELCTITTEYRPSIRNVLASEPSKRVLARHFLATHPSACSGTGPVFPFSCRCLASH